MSVINNVLRDLETRESRFTPIDIAPVSAPAAARAFSKPVLLLVPLLLLGIAGGWNYLQQQAASVVEIAAPAPAAAEPPAPASAPREMVADSVLTAPEQVPDSGANHAPSLAPAAAEIDPPAEQPLVKAPASAVAFVTAAPQDQSAGPAVGNQIVGLQLRESEHEMQMAFVLRDRAVAYLKERGQNHFSYHLRGVDSQIAAPQMRDNRWIEALAIGTAGNGVDIEFTTAPNILVETRQGRLDGEPTWSISLRQMTPAPTAAARSGGGEAVAGAEQTAPQPAADGHGLAAVDAGPGSAAPAVARAESDPAPVKLEIRASSSGARSANQLEYALELIKSRRVAEAETLLRELLGGPEDHLARQRLLALYSREQQPQRFRQLLAESLQRYPRDALFQTEYAQLLFSHGAYREAIELLAAQPSLDANQLALVAASYQRLDQHLDAVRHYRLALAQNAANARNWIALGVSLEHSEALADALQSYQRAAALGSLEPGLQAFVRQRSDVLRRALD